MKVDLLPSIGTDCKRAACTFRNFVLDKKDRNEFSCTKSKPEKRKENEEMVDQFADKTTIGNNFHDNLLFKFQTIEYILKFA
jgi:hypothetical protein